MTRLNWRGAKLIRDAQRRRPAPAPLPPTATRCVLPSGHGGTHLMAATRLIAADRLPGECPTWKAKEAKGATDGHLQ
jgi:hypothetical protein